jgi:hypothetical protein
MIASLLYLGGCTADNRETELLRKEAELAKKEAELAKKELELSKAAAPNTNQSANVNSPSTEPVAPRIVKTPAGLNSFSENTDEEVLAVDLNGDGHDEYIGIIGLCGSGGCDLGVFKRTPDGYVNLFAVDEMMFPDPAPPPDPKWKPDYRFLAGPQSHNGYLDIVLTWQKGKPSRFTFDGDKYR